MKYKWLKNILPLIPVICCVAISMSISHSCANTTTPPSGGPKDTIPPSLLAVLPYPGDLNIPTHNTKIVFTFNEYVQIKDQKNIVLSPPMEKPLKAKLSGKSVVITFEEDLLPETTYTIDITGAIVDNNEGNPFPGYTLVFSTGNQIDSMYVTGIVQDCNTLNPVKGATVMLYKDHADSAVFLHRPNAAVKTDDWGFFCIRNVQDTLFRLYAVMDENNNNMYDPETEKVAFADSLVRPTHKVANDVYELYKFDMKDTTSCLKRHNDYELNLFRGKPSKQYIVNKVRTGDRSAYITFMAPFAQINSVWFKGLPKEKTITQFNPTKDSLLLWVNDPRKQKDTLFLTVDYMKTDSTGALVQTKEQIKLGRDKKDIAAAKKSSRKDIKHEDTIAVYKAVFAPETFEQYGINFNFENPLIEEAFDSIRFEITNPRQQKEKGKYTWSRDTTDLRNYVIRPAGKLLQGYEYKFTLPHRKFKDINGFYNDSTVVSIKLPDDDKLSTLRLNMKNVKNTYIVDLMTEKRDKVVRSFTIRKDGELVFPYVKEGKYCIRMVEDLNNNNMVETGDLLSHRQPEKVKFFKLKDGSFLLGVPASSEISQDLDIEKIFE